MADQPTPDAAAADPLAVVEHRVWSLLDRYRPTLVDATIYGIASLAWPGAKKHDYFAGVKRQSKAVSIYLLLMDTYPDVFDQAPEALQRRRTGKATLTLPTLDDELAAALSDLLDAMFERYRVDHES